MARMSTMQELSISMNNLSVNQPISHQITDDTKKLGRLASVSTKAMINAITQPIAASAHLLILPPLSSEGAKSLARKFRQKKGQQSNAFRQSKFLGKGILQMIVLQTLAEHDPEASLETRTMHAHAIVQDDVMLAIAEVNGLDPVDDTPSSKEALADEIRARLWLSFAVAPPFFETPDYEAGFAILEPWVAGLLSLADISAAEEQYPHNVPREMEMNF